MSKTTMLEAIKTTFDMLDPIELNDAEKLKFNIYAYLMRNPCGQLNLDLRQSISKKQILEVHDCDTWAYMTIPDTWLFQVIDLLKDEGLNLDYHRDKRYIGITLKVGL